MILPNIDTLVASVDIQLYEDSADALLELLAEKKEKAKSAATESASIKTLVKIGDMSFQILPIGKMGYAYILHNEFYEVNISQYRSKNKDFYPIMIRLKSECLWSLGHENAWRNIMSWVQDNIGEIATEKISRIDLCCHTDIFALDENDIVTFKGNFHNENFHRFRRNISSMNFGTSSSNKVYCRIYNKALEVTQKRKKLWFYDIWENAGAMSKNVWNIEFQLNREFLKEYNIETVKDAFNRLQTIWEFCTKEWIVKVNRDNVRIERCSIDSAWQAIQSAFTGFKSTPLVKRERQLNCEAEALIPGILGNISSFAALKNILDDRMALSLVEIHGSNYYKGRNSTFRKEVSKKIDLLVTESEA